MYVNTQIMKKYSMKIFIAFILCIPSVFLLAQVQEEESVDGIYLVHRPYADSIVLRWAPTNYSLMMKMARYGVYVERKELGAKDFERLNSTPLKAYTMDEFREKANTENDYVYAAAHALYEEAAYNEALSSPMATALEIYNAQNQRFALAAMAADFSAEASTALAWRFTDKDVKKGDPYYYRIVLAQEEGLTLYSNTEKVRTLVGKYLNAIHGMEIREGEKELEFSWPKAINNSNYIAFQIEISADGGRSWTAERAVPTLLHSKETEETDNKYILKLEENYLPRKYRIIGINSFGERSQPSEPIQAQGVDLTAPIPPVEVYATDTGDNRIRLTWNNQSEATDHAGLIIGRSANYSGPFKPIVSRPISEKQSSFIDEDPIPYQTNYYIIYSMDTLGNILPSNVAIAVRLDDEPPAQPLGLTGRVDSTGNVFLIWEPGKELDLHGYRVYKAYSKNREFIQISTSIVKQNYFFDKTSLNTLNEEVFYKIVALDNNFNPSEYSASIALRRPDKIAPSAAVMGTYQASASSIELHWKKSSSSDLNSQEIWRKKEDGDWKKLATLSADLTRQVDKLVEANTHYTYKVISIDEVGLYSESKALKIFSGNYAELPVPDGFRAEQLDGEMQVSLTWDSSIPNTRVIVYRSESDKPMRIHKYIAAEDKGYLDPLSTDLDRVHYSIQYLSENGVKSRRSPIISITLKK